MRGRAAIGGAARSMPGMPEESPTMYGDEGEARYDRPAAPLGVKLVIVVLLVCGLALAALPLTVWLRGGEEPGRIALRNRTGTALHHVRVVRIVGDQERLVGGAHELADGATTDVTFSPDGGLSLRVEVVTDDGARHELPLALGEPVVGDFTTTVELRPGPAIVVVRTTAPAPESSALPAPSRTDPAPPARAETAAAESPRRGPYPLPEGWSEEWRPWFEHVDWAIGPEAGLARARESGRPALLFYTATW